MSKAIDLFGDLIDWFYKNHLTGVSEAHATVAIVVFVVVSLGVVCGLLYGIWRLVT